VIGLIDLFPGDQVISFGRDQQHLADLDQLIGLRRAAPLRRQIRRVRVEQRQHFQQILSVLDRQLGDNQAATGRSVDDAILLQPPQRFTHRRAADR
jgi:hypothetical protein